jgi:superfamily II DNA or RNA helicase
MVSEGVDIPRLRVGVFATNTTTELFFRQAVGRLVRWTPGVRSQKAFLFIPDDLRLRRWAGGIAEQRRHSLKVRSGDDSDAAEFDDREAEARAADAAEEQMSLFAVISAVATDTEAVGPSIFGEDHPDDWDDDEVPADESLELRIAVPPPKGRRLGTPTDPTKTRKQTKIELRAANSAAVAELVRFSKMDHRQANAELNRLTGIRKVTEATVEQLEARLDHANKWLKRL